MNATAVPSGYLGQNLLLFTFWFIQNIRDHLQPKHVGSKKNIQKKQQGAIIHHDFQSLPSRLSPNIDGDVDSTLNQQVILGCPVTF